MSDAAWLDNRALNEWLANGERGLSSEAIVANLTGRITPRRYERDISSPPYDPADFRRCQLLLRAVPLLRLRLPEMAKVSPVWAALVARWDEIADAIEEEAPGYLDSRHGGSAPNAYRMIRECREAKVVQ